MTSDAAIGVSPGRVNLIGEHTDYNDGYVLPIALGWRSTVRAARRDDGRVGVRSEQGFGEELLGDEHFLPPQDHWWGYVAGVVWALRQRGHHVGGVDLAVDSDVPPGAGLSSSAALECATALALDALAGLGLGPDELAEVAQEAENTFVGVPTGPMDQRASLWCTADHALLLDCRTLTGTQVPCRLPDGLALLLVDTRSPHRLVTGEYAARREACADAARALGIAALRDVTDLRAALAALDDDVLERRVRHVVTENARVLACVDALAAGDWARVGELFTASHASMRDDYEITVPTVDLAVEVALGSGALGARMTGGGFGGSVIALVPDAQAATLSDALAAAYADGGFENPVVHRIRPEAGGLSLSGR